jgi:trypsin
MRHASSLLSNTRNAHADDGKIVGGKVVPPGKYPFFASIDCCGATLIRHDMLLTAGHCDCVQENASTALLNITNRTTGSQYLIERRIVHPSYSDTTVMNDIAILKLSCSSKVKPIALNFNRNLPVVGTVVSAIGIGLIDNYELPSKMHETTVQVISNRICHNIYRNYYTQVNGTAMMCAGGFAHDTCLGDSGGPLFVNGNRGSKVQVGITSWGEGCAFQNYPGVYTRISTYRKFILDTIRKYSSPVPIYCP